MPWIAKSQTQSATMPAITAMTTGGKKSGLKSFVTAFTTRSGTSAALSLSASIGSAFSLSGCEPSAPATIPSGRSRSSTSWRTLSALTPRLIASLRAAAISSFVRAPSASSAIV
jgi:hypothetical protein